MNKTNVAVLGSQGWLIRYNFPELPRHICKAYPYTTLIMQLRFEKLGGRMSIKIISPLLVRGDHMPVILWLAEKGFRPPTR